MPKPEPVPFVSGNTSAVDQEQRAVHDVYDAIAPHFSQTRQKPWPLITSFLESLPVGSMGLDSGAGNGKYVPHATSYPSPDGPVSTAIAQGHAGQDGRAGYAGPSNGPKDKLPHVGPSRRVIALDRSQGLLDIAKTQLDPGVECLRAELGYEGWRRGVFDWAISVAAIHHLMTHERRRQAIQALIRPLVLTPTPPFSRFMIYVWAYEQGSSSRRTMGRAAEQAHLSARSHIQHRQDTSSLSDTGVDTGAAGGVVEDDVARNKVQDVLVPWVFQPLPNHHSPRNQQSSRNQPPSIHEPLPPLEKKVYHRYYHLFTAGELANLVVEAGKKEGFVMLPTITKGENSVGSVDTSDIEDHVGSGNRVRLDDGDKWLKINRQGWELDNWWLEGEVGISRHG